MKTLVTGEDRPWIGIAKSMNSKGVYFVLDNLFGIKFLYSGTLKECRIYCRKHGYSVRIKWDY